VSSNAEARLVEAKDRAWLGEVAALEESLRHLGGARPKPSNSSQRRAVTISASSRLGEGGGQDTTETGNQ
jgi:hypothetical protein